MTQAQADAVETLTEDDFGGNETLAMRDDRGRPVVVRWLSAPGRDERGEHVDDGPARLERLCREAIAVQQPGLVSPHALVRQGARFGFVRARAEATSLTVDRVQGLGALLSLAPAVDALFARGIDPTPLLHPGNLLFFGETPALVDLGLAAPVAFVERTCEDRKLHHPRSVRRFERRGRAGSTGLVAAFASTWAELARGRPLFVENETEASALAAVARGEMALRTSGRLPEGELRGPARDVIGRALVAPGSFASCAAVAAALA